ncbi:hypothetical protein ACQKEI_01150 [Psychrobacter namhaensis]|uniref:hypothetical protein n=1 Tax=Psychrobacter namhaensis TaxID=292734 RepID=UPI003D04D7EE
MSQSKTISKVVSRFEIGFDDETKVVIDALKSKMDEVTRALSVKNDSHGDRLLVAMQAEAANDAPKPEILELGQWVFEGQDEKWQSAAVNSDGRAYLHNMPKNMMYFNHSSYGWCAKRFDRHEMKLIDGLFNPSGFTCGFIERETVNDVDYLSETVPEIQGMEASDIIIDEMGRDYSPNSNCLHAVVPQITQADMQLIFIKNLSDVLIQRMHSMDRFSEDDFHIRELMPWDIVTGRNSFNDKQPNFAVVIAVSHIDHSDKSSFGIADLTSRFSLNQYVHTGQYVKITPSHNETYRTITESELVWFRAALEACYA